MIANVRGWSAVAASLLLLSWPAAADNMRRLELRHHTQHTKFWCWAAGVAMIAEYLTHKPVEDCELLSAYDKELGGPGQCCGQADHPGDQRCMRAGYIEELSRLLGRMFQLHGVEVARPWTWQEVVTNIDAGRPMMVLLVHSHGSHIVVISGYRPSGTVYVNDPGLGPREVRYSDFAAAQGTAGSVWVRSWVFRAPDANKAIDTAWSTSSRSASPPHETPIVTTPPTAPAGVVAKPTQIIGQFAPAGVRYALPRLSDRDTLTVVNTQIESRLEETRTCYEREMKATPPPPIRASILLTFMLSPEGTPIEVRTSGPAELSPPMLSCITGAVAGWDRLYSGVSRVILPQQIKLTFEHR
jgi:hypothetical protein